MSKKIRKVPFLRHFSLVSFISVITLNLSVLEFGFDNSLSSVVQAMDSFDRDFDMYQDNSHHKLDPVKLSLISSMGTPFRAAMILMALFLGERFGRWVVFVVMQVGSLVGAIVLITASRHMFAQVVVGRVILTSFSGWHDWLIPMYMAEIVPGPVRGTVISSYMVFNYLGSFLASLAAYLCSHHFVGDRLRSLQYRIPFALMGVSPLLCLGLCWVLPESPRWLVRKGYHKAAVRALQRLNGGSRGYSAEEEARLLRETIEEDVETKGGWKDLFQGTNLRRTIVSLVCIFYVQFTGQAFVTKYGTIFVKGLGIMDPMEFALIERGTCILAPIFLTLFVDRLGRRRIFIGGSFLYTCCLCVIGGIGTMKMQRVGYAIISLYIVAAILHIVSLHGIGMIVAAEVPHLRLRDKTLTASYVLGFIGEFGVGFSLPYLLYAPYANLESKVGFIYGAIALTAAIWGIFCMPDTGRRSLEELEELWQQGVPAYKFSTYSAKGGVGLRVSQLESHVGDAGKQTQVVGEGSHASGGPDYGLQRFESGTETDGKASRKRGVEVVHEEFI